MVALIVTFVVVFAILSVAAAMSGGSGEWEEPIGKEVDK